MFPLFSELEKKKKKIYKLKPELEECLETFPSMQPVESHPPGWAWSFGLAFEGPRSSREESQDILVTP